MRTGGQVHACEQQTLLDEARDLNYVANNYHNRAYNAPEVLINRVQIKICTKADTDSLIGLNFSFPSPAGALSA